MRVQHHTRGGGLVCLSLEWSGQLRTGWTGSVGSYSAPSLLTALISWPCLAGRRETASGLSLCFLLEVQARAG